SLARPHPFPPRRSSDLLPSAQEATTLLGRIKSDVRENRWPPGTSLPDCRPLLQSDDRSLEVHSCHGHSRQVEVLRDAILHALDRSEEHTSELQSPDHHV